jgi:hypothetical protein
LTDGHPTLIHGQQAWPKQQCVPYTIRQWRKLPKKQELGFFHKSAKNNFDLRRFQQKVGSLLFCVIRDQGDQILRNFVQWVFVHFGAVLKITEVPKILGFFFPNIYR